MPSLTSRIVAWLAAARRCFLPSTHGSSHAVPSGASKAAVRSGNQLELLLDARIGELEPGDADAQEPDWALWGEPPQELERHRLHPLGGPHRLRQRPGASVG